jgi:tetratricopeptide (TPR) repeat protein
MATRGDAAKESLDVYSRAAQLVSVAGSPREQMDVYLGLYNVHFGRAELERAMAMAVQYMQLAETEHLLHARAYTLLGQTHAAMGAFAQARQAFERAQAMFAEAPETPETVGVFGSQHVIALAFVSGVYFALGEPALAQSATARSIERARELGNTLSIALALVTDLLTPIPGGLSADRAQAEKVVHFCRDNSLRNFEAWALFASGAIEARRGDPREGIESMRAAIDMAEGDELQAVPSRAIRDAGCGSFQTWPARGGLAAHRPSALLPGQGAPRRCRLAPTSRRSLAEAREAQGRAGGADEGSRDCTSATNTFRGDAHRELAESISLGWTAGVAAADSSLFRP